MADTLIKPRTLKGFRDYLPNAMMAREQLIDTARQVYRSFGFSPIDTPALEYSEILLGKGGAESDKQLFRFTDQGDRDVAMRFDLTVPFARFAAQNLQELGTPFKRYHIASVWRGEKPGLGRYREFMQCDFDTIGTRSNAADIETLFVIHDLIERLGFTEFTIHVNNRQVLNGLLEKLGLLPRAGDVLRVLDKFAKIGREGVQRELIESVSITETQADRVLALSELQGTADSVLAELTKLLSGNDAGAAGIAALRELFDASQTAGIPDERLKLDVSIARGLDYYTGTIYETFLNDRPQIGSVCSGGRYDNLAGRFTKQSLPGVGASLGLDRLLAAMEDMGMVETASTPAPVLVTQFDTSRLGDYLRIGRLLRKAGIATEVFPEPRGIGKQLKYANRKGFRVALIAGTDEFEHATWQVKDLQRGEQSNVAEANLAEHVQSILAEDG